ncbi:hypothetical protein OAM14_00565 [Candidatus Pelagibacter sp.]|nr:hypothetical protein [Candidatus Pelagibacter sp.]
MFDFLGFISVLIVALFTCILTLKYPQISKILLVALILRIIFIILGNYFITLPDSTADADSLESEAWLISQNGFFNLKDYYKGPDPRFISWLIAIPYTLFGRSIIMAQSISMLFGVGCVFLGWKLALKIWDQDIAKKVAWTIALFPSLILYSVLVMREAYVCFFLLVALVGVVDWVKTENFKSILISIVGFIGASYFHGAMAIGAITFIIIVGFVSLKQLIKQFINFKIKIKIFISFVFFLILFSLYVNNYIKVPYINNFDFMTDIGILIEKSKISTRGVASYPEWTIVNGPVDLIYKAPIRSLFFLYSPLPWEIKEIKHFIGFFDALLYFYMSILILLNFKIIWKDPALRLILLILLSYLIVFGIGVGNFGTAIRHRSKIVVLLILLAAPKIKKFIFYKKI